MVKKDVKYGEAVPNWYGVAYSSPVRACLICYPIPLNIIVALLYNLRIWMKARWAILMSRMAMKNRLVGSRKLIGVQEHNLFMYLTPYIEKAGYTWKITPILDDSMYSSNVVIE